MSNIYSLIAELIISNALRDTVRSTELAGKLYIEAMTLNSVVELVIKEAAKLQPIMERESSSLN